MSNTPTTWHSIREASMISGLPESTLRYYEQIGIIDPIARDPSSGHRVYSDKDIESLTPSRAWRRRACRLNRCANT